MISPLLLDLVADLAEASERPPLIGISGAQGSGKTTLARAAAERLGGVSFSLDDVYLTHAERAALGREVHPLLATRGPPGTHDLALAERTIDALLAGEATGLPRFDKLVDDRAEPLPFTDRARVVILEGWCLGATAQDAAALAEPVNALERVDDRDGAWRTHVNTALAGPYQAFFGRFDAIVHLAAPSFDTVLDWRCEQEAGLLGLKREDLPPGRREVLARFIQHFERITRHMLAGGVRATETVRLNADRSPSGWS